MGETESLDGNRAGDILSRAKVFAGKVFHLKNFQFLTYAKVREVHGYFDGSKAKPSEGATAEEVKKWKKEVARNILLTALDSN